MAREGHKYWMSIVKVWCIIELLHGEFRADRYFAPGIYAGRGVGIHTGAASHELSSDELPGLCGPQ